MKGKLPIGLLAVAVVAALLAIRGPSVQAQPVASITLPSPGSIKELYPGCNNISLTFPDGTTSQMVLQAVTPAGAVEAMWRHNAALNAFEGFSPAAPQASDLLTVNFLDSVWLCVAAALPPAPTSTPATATATSVPLTATRVPPTPTRVPPTATPRPPTPTRVPPTPIPRTEPLSPPQYLGPVQAGGKAEVTISNDAPYALTIEFDGPESRTISIPRCPTCVTYTVPPAFCPEKGPKEVIRLTPGVYRVSARVDDPSIAPLAGTWDLNADTGYFSCFYIVTVHTSG
jgi:hypothetical protein